MIMCCIRAKIVSLTAICLISKFLINWNVFGICGGYLNIVIFANLLTKMVPHTRRDTLSRHFI
jgi:hypothetical protein